MTIIYYSGWELEADVTGKDALDQHIVIRGYDLAGNLLSTIAYDKLPAREYIDPAFEYQTRYEITGLYDRFGNAQSPVIAINTIPRIHPEVMAADAHGHIYVASSTVNWQEYGGPNLYYDFFRKYRRGGDRIDFPQLHGGAIKAIALAADGSIYVGGAAVGTSCYNLRKYDSSGTLIWSAASDGPLPERDTVLHITLDGSGDVYITAEYTALPGTGMTGRLAKYSGSDGSLIWRRWMNEATDRNKIVLYEGSVYFASGWKYYFVDDLVAIPSTIETADTAEVVAYERIGGVPERYILTQWSMDDGSFLGGISQTDTGGGLQNGYYLSFCPVNEQFLISVLDSADVFYLVTYANDFSEISANILTSYVPQGIRIDSAGNRFWISTREQVRLGGYGAPSYDYQYGAYHFTAFAEDGTPLWGGLNARGATGVWTNGGSWPNLYNLNWVLGGTEYSGTLLDMHDAYDNIPDAGHIGLDAPGEYWRVTDVCVVEATETPALALPIAFGIPTLIGDLYSHAPGLALALALGTPLWMRDYAALFARTIIYRLVINGILELPLSWIQCRRSLNNDTQVTAVCPGITQDQADQLLTLLNTPMILYRGPQGITQLDVLLSATLTSVRYDVGSARASATLTGQASAETGQVKTRTLTGISYDQQTPTSRRLRGNVDTWLRPGDALDIGETEPMTVAEIVYQISPSAAFMEVSQTL